MHDDSNFILKTNNISIVQTKDNVIIKYKEKEYTEDNLWYIVLLYPHLTEPLNTELTTHLNVRLNPNEVKRHLAEKRGQEYWINNKRSLDRKIAQLDSDRYIDREEARRALDAQIPYLRSLNTKDLSYEQLASISSLRKLEDYYVDSPEIISEWLLYDRKFLIRCLALEDREMREVGKKQLELILERQFDYDVDGDYVNQAAKIKEMFDEPSLPANN
jgi:hypothetical protein